MSIEEKEERAVVFRSLNNFNRFTEVTITVPVKQLQHHHYSIYEQVIALTSSLNSLIEKVEKEGK
jgi:hypothetical protein